MIGKTVKIISEVDIEFEQIGTVRKQNENDFNFWWIEFPEGHARWYHRKGFEIVDLDFKDCDFEEFLELHKNYNGYDTTILLKAIWKYGNRKYSEGYKDGETNSGL